MGHNSKIEWTDHTFNPWIGCTKVSDGCKHCYAETMMDKRYGRVKWGPQGTRQRTSEANWRKPLAWNKQAEAEGRRAKVFCASLADVFERNDQLIDWRYELWDLIETTPNLDWLLLTKRPENVLDMVPWPWHKTEIGGLLLEKTNGLWPDNVWIGTSVENQTAADERIPHLLRIPAPVKFLSCEPLLGPIDLVDWIGCHCPGDYYANGGHSIYCPRGVEYVGGKINWVIVGGESGPNAHPMHPDWAQSMRDECQAAGVAFFMKQWGEWLPVEPGELNDYGEWVGEGPKPRITRVEGRKECGYYCDPDIDLHPDHDYWFMKRVGKKNAGRLLDGREWNEMPIVERIQNL